MQLKAILLSAVVAMVLLSPMIEASSNGKHNSSGGCGCHGSSASVSISENFPSSYTAGQTYTIHSQFPVAPQVPKVGSMSKSTKAPYRQAEAHLSRLVEHPSRIQTAEAAHGHSTGQPLLLVAEQSMSTLPV